MQEQYSKIFQFLALDHVQSMVLYGQIDKLLPNMDIDGTIWKVSF